VIKCRDPKTNLVPDENLANALKSIDFTMMIPVGPYLAHQLSGFMIINLYGVCTRVKIDGNTRRHKGFRQVRIS
jgi:hypothetical protein